MYSLCKTHAFTLIELLVTITILAIISMIAIPHYHQFRERQEVAQLLTTIRQHVNLSKSLASTYHTQIVICSSSNATKCENNQWHKGMIIFSDLNQNKTLDSNEPIQKTVITDMKYGSFQWNGGAANPNSITFQNDSGLPRGSQGNFMYCSLKHPANHRYIAISPMGHTRIQTTTSCQSL